LPVVTVSVASLLRVLASCAMTDCKRELNKINVKHAVRTIENLYGKFAEDMGVFQKL